ncbi:MAG: hypothetical protein RDU59_11060 [Thermodesulfobacteriota bacterium]|nr:hypothetical protein [Thermodesulfobacteriota bacterium]
MPLRKPRTNDWPSQVRLFVYDEGLRLIEESRDRKYDLNDNLFQAWPEGHRIVYLGVETGSKNWPVWDEASLRWIEARIEWDLEFDGNQVKVIRHTQQIGFPCTQEFIWRLDIRDG